MVEQDEKMTQAQEAKTQSEPQAILREIRDLLAILADAAGKRPLWKRILRLRSFLTIALLIALCFIHFPTTEVRRAALVVEDGVEVSMSRLKMPSEIPSTMPGQSIPIDPKRWKIPDLLDDDITVPLLRVELFRGGLAYHDPYIVVTQSDHGVIARLNRKSLQLEGPTTIRITPKPTGLDQKDLTMAKRIIETHGLIVGEEIVRFSDFVDFNTGVGQITIAVVAPAGLPRLAENIAALFGLLSSR